MLSWTENLPEMQVYTVCFAKKRKYRGKITPVTHEIYPRPERQIKELISHYFAAQTYIDLYARTGDSSHLKKAYELAVNNVNCLVNEQRGLNAVYLAPVVEAEEPKGVTKEQKEEIKAYNKMLKEIRKTELPPVLWIVSHD